jgi:hypothetical protein
MSEELQARIDRLEREKAELVEALKELVRLHNAGIRPQITRGGLREEEDFRDLIDTAEALIRKAEGKE